MKQRDYVRNGVFHGNSQVGAFLMSGADPGTMRPFIDRRDNRHYMSLRTNWDQEKEKWNRETMPIANETGILFYDEWKYLDTAVSRAATPRLKAWRDLRAANTLRIPSWGKTAAESQMIGDITPAEVNMSGLAIADQDFPVGDRTGVPLPIIHKDAKIGMRELATSRESNIPLDTTFLELAAIKVAEEIEKFTVGVGIAYSFGGFSIYGYTNHPQRLTVELTDPTDVGWTPGTLINEIIQMRLAAEDVGFYGPFKMYLGRGWSAVLDADYSTVKGDNTLRQRIAMIDGISSIDTLDYMPENDIVLVQMDRRVAVGVVVMDLQTLQWNPSPLELQMKVMAIMHPWIRADFYEGIGLVHGSVAGS